MNRTLNVALIAVIVLNLISMAVDMYTKHEDRVVRRELVKVMKENLPRDIETLKLLREWKESKHDN